MRSPSAALICWPARTGRVMTRGGTAAGSAVRRLPVSAFAAALFRSGLGSCFGSGFGSGLVMGSVASRFGALPAAADWLPFPGSHKSPVLAMAFCRPGCAPCTPTGMTPAPRRYRAR